MSKKPLSSRGGSKNVPTGCMVLFFGIFAVVGAVATWFVGVKPAMELLAARSWEPVECRVLSSFVETHDSDDGGDTYSVEIHFEYRMRGRTYQSERYRFTDVSSSGRAGKERVVEAHPEGSVSTCWADPEAPEEAVFDRSFSFMYLIGFFPVAFLVVGAGGLWWVATGGLSSASGTSGAKRRRKGSSGVPASFQEMEGFGPQVLEPKAGPVAKVVGMLFVALFWNGIVSVFLWQEIENWRQYGFSLGCGTLFLLPFVVVGLLLIVGFFHALLALANPRPRLVIEGGPLAIGGTVTLVWEVTGRVERLRRFSLKLVGKEEARYRRGTDTHTDTETFCEQTLYETTEPMAMRRGSVTVAVPADTMHTFQAPNNKILWSLEVGADIPRWPDVADSYEVLVRPRGI